MYFMNAVHFDKQVPQFNKVLKSAVPNRQAADQ